MATPSINWDQFPHLSRAQRSTVSRMAETLGEQAAIELLRASPETHVPRIEAFVQFEQAIRADAAQTAANAAAEQFEQAEQQTRNRFAELEQHTRVAVDAAVAAALAAAAQHARPAPTAQNNRRKPVRLDVPKYNGTSEENLAHWLLSVRKAAMAQLIEDHDLMVAFAISHLAGRARDWSYSKLMTDDNAFPTWELFVEQLRTAFQPANAQMRFKAKLLACRQGKRSLHEFVQELRYLNAAVASDPLSEATKITISLEGLEQGPARTQLYRQIPTTLDEAFQVALMEEHAAKSARGLPSTPPRGTPGAATPMDLGTIEAARCYTCGRVGHMARDCRSGRRPGVQPPRFGPNARASGRFIRPNGPQGPRTGGRFGRDHRDGHNARGPTPPRQGNGTPQ